MAGSLKPKQDEEGCRDQMVRSNTFFHGGTSSLLSTIITFPVYKTVFRQQIHNAGVSEDTILHQFTPSSQNLISPSALPALAGFGAGMVEAVVCTPLERVQSVLQNGKNDRNLPTHKSILVRLNAQKRSSGYYRGLLPITARNALGSFIYFGLKEPLKAAVEGRGLSPVVSSFISGVLSSMVISLPLYPLTVLAANMQKQVGGEDKAVMASWKTLWESRQRSVALLYRGGSLVVLRSGISWGITTAIYDMQQKYSG
ncbi:solute carrier family 25 member 53 [Notothenia coriiceps]|uniref:Solute carrier family 25 member 53 n=1 Tax=Notothenia coriiceps TaxID=8208 RepID=A0A6I9PBH9_9TELE|nr:PREDICTED: solute carrier family 25 member 53 [Notothenia coriiceps]